MKKLSELRLEDWQGIAFAQGIEIEDKSVNELVAATAEKLGVTEGGDDKEGKKVRKKAVYAKLVELSDENTGSADKEADASKDAEETAEASGDAPSDQEKLMALSVDALTKIATEEKINIEAYTEKEDIVNMIASMRALRTKNLEEAKARPTMSRQIRTKGADKPVNERSASQAFARFAMNVCRSFSTGVFARRLPTVAEIAGHLGKSSHGFTDVELVEKTEGKGEDKKKYVFLKVKIEKETLQSEKIYVS